MIAALRSQFTRASYSNALTEPHHPDALHRTDTTTCALLASQPPPVHPCAWALLKVLASTPISNYSTFTPKMRATLRLFAQRQPLIKFLGKRSAPASKSHRISSEACRETTANLRGEQRSITLLSHILPLLRTNYLPHLPRTASNHSNMVHSVPLRRSPRRSEATAAADPA